METVRSVEEQIADLLRADVGVLDAFRLPGEDDASVGARIVTQPLKRAADTDPFLQANEPTPQCFDPEAPFWLRPSLSIAAGAPMYAADRRAERYLSLRYTLAWYAAPDVADVRLWQMRSACMRAVRKRRVVFPDGTGACLLPSGELLGPVPPPEFPGAGKQLMERLAVLGVWRRE